MVKRWIAMGDLANIADDTDCIMAPDNTILVLAADYDKIDKLGEQLLGKVLEQRERIAALEAAIGKCNGELGCVAYAALAPPTGEG